MATRICFIRSRNSGEQSWQDWAKGILDNHGYETVTAERNSPEAETANLVFVHADQASLSELPLLLAYKCVVVYDPLFFMGFSCQKFYRTVYRAGFIRCEQETHDKNYLQWLVDDCLRELADLQPKGEPLTPIQALKAYLEQIPRNEFDLL